MNLWRFTARSAALFDRTFMTRNACGTTLVTSHRQHSLSTQSIADDVLMTDPRSAYGNTITADIREITEESDGVLRLRLHTREPFTFAPGQWVDFHIPDVSHIGGFSVCTPPSLLTQHGHLDIAVQRSRSPPAAWVHEVASPGMQVQLQVGGPMSLQPHQCEAPCLFIGGGIGVAPLLSMWSHWAEAHERRMKVNGAESHDTTVRATMLYTVKSTSRCALLQQLLQPLTSSNPMDMCLHFTDSLEASTTTAPLDLSPSSQHTALQISVPESLQSLPASCSLQEGRITAAQLAQHLTRLGSSCHVFLCGPPAMSDWAYGVLTGELGHDTKHVHLEKWW